MNNEKQEVGLRGETQACAYLESLGHFIVARNWRYAHLEIDIISLDGDGIHIVEVKSRTAPTIAEPQSSVGRIKQRKIIGAAQAFMHSDLFRSLCRPDAEVFFDIITVVFDGKDRHIEYFPQAFIPIYA